MVDQLAKPGNTRLLNPDTNAGKDINLNCSKITLDLETPVAAQIIPTQLGNPPAVADKVAVGYPVYTVKGVINITDNTIGTGAPIHEYWLVDSIFTSSSTCQLLDDRFLPDSAHATVFPVSLHMEGTELEGNKTGVDTVFSGNIIKYTAKFIRTQEP